MGDPYEPISVFDSYENRVFNYKWKFLMFQAVYRLNISKKISSNISMVMFYINLLVYLLPSLYLFGKTIGRNIMMESETVDIFPYSQLFSFLTPYLISSTTFSFFVFVFMVASLTAFIYSFFSPVNISDLFWILNPEVHILLLPLICGNFAYCFSIIIKSSISFTPFKIFSCIFVIITILYFFMYMIIAFVLEVSIMKPHPQFTKYFAPFYWWVPLFRIFSSTVYFMLGRIDSADVCMVLLVIIIIMLCALIFNFWYYQPFCNSSSTPANIAQFLIMIVNSICLIFYIYGYFTNTAAIYGLLPIEAIVFAQLSSSICSYRKNHFIRYLINIVPGQYLSNEYLNDIFKNFHTSTQFYLLTVFGVQTNCYVVSTQEYVGYLISKFPTKEWVLRYTIEMYSAVWGVDNNTYRYFLHLLSSNAHSFPTQTMLFETVYCYMQSAYNTSPIITNKMSSFTEMIILFAQMTKNLWSHAPESAEGLNYDMRYCHEALESCATKIKNLLVMYPFSPEVHFMNCIYLADCQKNFEKASHSYDDGTLFLVHRDKAITKIINSWHSMNSKVNEEVRTTKDENIINQSYSFLSVCSQLSGFVRRKVNMLVPNQFLKLFSNSYTAERNQLLPEFQLITKWFKRLYTVLVIFVIIEIAFALLLFFNFHGLEDIVNEYDFITEFNNRTRQLINSVQDLYYLTIIFDYANEEYPPNEENGISSKRYRLNNEYIFIDQNAFLTTFQDNPAFSRDTRIDLSFSSQDHLEDDIDRIESLSYSQKKKLYSLVSFVENKSNTPKTNTSSVVYLTKNIRNTLADGDENNEEEQGSDKIVQDFILFHINEILPDLTDYMSYRDTLLRFYNGIIEFNESDYYFNDFPLFQRNVLIKTQNYSIPIMDDPETFYDYMTNLCTGASILSENIVDYALTQLMDKYYSTLDLLKLHMIVMAAIVVIVILIIVFFSQSMKHDVFVIFKTIQYSVRKMLEQQFNALLKGKEVDMTPISPSSSSVPYILAIISVLVLELEFLALLLISQQFENVLKKYDVVDFNLSTSIVEVHANNFYQQIKREFEFCNTLGFEQCHQTLPADYCTHAYFTNNVYIDKGIFIGQLHSQSLLNILMLVVGMVFVIFLVLAVKQILHSFRVYKEATYLLFSIPISIGRSNYLFNIILTGGMLEKDKAQKYADEISKLSCDYKEFGTIDFDAETGATLNAVGNVEGIIGYIPENIDELKESILADGGSQAVIDKMFENKGNKIIIMAKHEQTEYMAVFLSPTKIFIKDESNDQIVNRGDVIDFMYLKYQRKQINEIAKAGVILLVSEDDDEISKLFEMGKKYEHLFNIDARFKMLHYVMDFNEEPEVVAKEAISFLTEAKEILKNGCCAASYGGKVIINQANKQMIEKSRIVGKPLQIALSAILPQSTNVFMCQKEILEAAKYEFDQNNMEIVKVDGNEEYSFVLL